MLLSTEKQANQVSPLLPLREKRQTHIPSTQE